MKKSLLFLAIAAIAIMSLTACSTGTSDAATTPEPVASNNAIIAEGRLLPVSWLEHSFTLPGTVEAVLVNNGDMVTVGQPLVALVESADTALAITRAEEGVLVAQQALDSLLANADLALAEAELKVLNAQEAVDTALADYEADDSEENRILLDIATASIALTDGQFAKITSGDGVDVDLREAAEARLSSAKATLASAQALRDAHELKSNLEGTVIDLDLQPGQSIMAGSPVITVADLSSWVVKTDNLTETQVASVAIGDQVDVVLDALPGVKFTGEVSRINARFEEKRGDTTYTVTINVNEMDPAMRWGMTAAIYFQP